MNIKIWDNHNQQWLEPVDLLSSVEQSEQFYCTCSRAKGLDHDEEGMPYCIECEKPVQ